MNKGKTVGYVETDLEKKTGMQGKARQGKARQVKPPSKGRKQERQVEGETTRTTTKNSYVRNT